MGFLNRPHVFANSDFAFNFSTTLPLEAITPKKTDNDKERGDRNRPTFDRQTDTGFYIYIYIYIYNNNNNK